MKYTVVWIESAQDELADLWNRAANRQDIADASNTIDNLLRFNPYTYSESREGDLRIMFVPPLAVLFQISDSDCLVTVRAVWQPE